MEKADAKLQSPFGTQAGRSESERIEGSRTQSPTSALDNALETRNSGACCPNRSDAVPTLPRETRSPVLRAERRRPNAEVRRAKGEGRMRSAQMARTVSDRTLAGRRMHGGSVPRKDAKYAKPPPTQNSFAAWRTWRLGVRSGCRDLTPVGAHRSEAAHKEFLCGVAYLAPLREIRLPSPHSSGRTPIGGRRPLGNTPSGVTAPVLRARRGAPHFVRALKYGAASRPPALPFSRSPGRTAKAQRRSAKGEGCVGSDGGRRMHGALVPRKDAKYAKPPPTQNSFAAWRTWRLGVRSGCRDLTPVGAHRSEAAALWATRPRNSKLGTCVEVYRRCESIQPNRPGSA